MLQRLEQLVNLRQCNRPSASQAGSQSFRHTARQTAHIYAKDSCRAVFDSGRHLTNRRTGRQTDRQKEYNIHIYVCVQLFIVAKCLRDKQADTWHFCHTKQQYFEKAL